MHGNHCEKRFHTTPKRGLRCFKKFEKVHLVILQDTQRHAGQFMKRSLECTLCFFFRAFWLHSIMTFPRLGGLNEAEGKEWAKKRDGERMEDECFEVCDDSVRNDKETERETAGFTAPRPTCLDLWMSVCPACVCVKDCKRPNSTADLVKLLKAVFGFIQCNDAGHFQWVY